MQSVDLRTEDGLRLEAELRLPEGFPRAAAVLCHPHPRHGGSKGHPLLWAIRNDLASRGFAVVSFNFRGVMGSEGSFEGGVGETADVRAAVDRAGEEGGGPVFVTGWSFGANVALRAALVDDRIAGLALIGYPLSESSLALPPLPSRAELQAFDRPILLLSGQADPFSAIPDLRSLARKLRRPTVEVMSSTDHFFWRREREAAAIVGRFAELALFDPSGDAIGM